MTIHLPSPKGKIAPVSKPEILFSPIRIGAMELKNRIVMPAMVLGLNEEQAQAFYVERARGGTAAIITSAADVDALTKEEGFGRTISLDDYLSALPHLAEAVHQAGAKVGFQLISAMPPPWNILRDVIEGRSSIYGRVKGIKKGLPTGSDQALPEGEKAFDDFSAEDIKATVEQVAQATARIKTAGFDFVEYHACHTHFSLLCQAFSPLSNHRQDRYGGDLFGRMRLGLECMAAARATVGGGYPLSYRLPALEGEPGGITLEDAIAYAAELEKVGVSIIHVSVGPSLPASPLPKEPMGTYAHLAEAVKRHVKIPVIGVGRINTPEVAEAILRDGKADLVAIGRQLIADPFWPSKVAEGHAEEIVPCDSCSLCYGAIGQVSVKPGTSICRLNPCAGRELEQPEAIS
jgi:2,4-dienoyl-CoA reductase (NADPH2)